MAGRARCSLILTFPFHHACCRCSPTSPESGKLESSTPTSKVDMEMVDAVVATSRSCGTPEEPGTKPAFNAGGSCIRGAWRRRSAGDDIMPSALRLRRDKPERSTNYALAVQTVGAQTVETCTRTLNPTTNTCTRSKDGTQTFARFNRVRRGTNWGRSAGQVCEGFMGGGQV
jgi:hypothetical protein